MLSSVYVMRLLRSHSPQCTHSCIHASALLILLASNSEHLRSQTTALREVWGMVYEKALQMTTWTDAANDNATLRQRIIISLQPGRMMVFMLDLQRIGAPNVVKCNFNLLWRSTVLRLLALRVSTSRRLEAGSYLLVQSL